MAQHTDARSLMDRARDGAFNKLDAQRERAATGLTSMVEALRQSGRQLEGEHSTVATYVDTAASQLERFSGGIRERDVKRIVTDVEQFARRQPTVFLGSAFALGLVAARFLKSSGEENGDRVDFGTGVSRGVSRGVSSGVSTGVSTGVAGGVPTRSTASPGVSQWPDDPIAGNTPVVGG